MRGIKDTEIKMGKLVELRDKSSVQKQILRVKNSFEKDLVMQKNQD